MLPNPISRSCVTDVPPPLSTESKTSSRVILPSFSASGAENTPSLPSASISRTTLIPPSFLSSRTRGGEGLPHDGDHPRQQVENRPSTTQKKPGLLPYLENVHTASGSGGVLGSSESSHSKKERKLGGLEPHSSSRHLFRSSSRGRSKSKEINSFPQQNTRKYNSHVGSKNIPPFHHGGENQSSPDEDGGLTNTASMLISISGTSQKLPEPTRTDMVGSASLRFSPTGTVMPIEQINVAHAQLDNSGGVLRSVRAPSRQHKCSSETSSQHGNSNLPGQPLHSVDYSSSNNTQKHPPHHLSNESPHQGSIPRLDRSALSNISSGPMMTLHSINSNSIGSANNINSTIRSAKEVLRKRGLPHSGPMRSSSFYKSSTSSSAVNRKKNLEGRPSPIPMSSEFQASGSITGHGGRSTAPDSDGSGGSASGRRHIGGGGVVGSDVVHLASHKSGLVGSMTSFLQPENSSGEESPLDFSALGARPTQRHQPQLSSILVSTASHNTISNNNILVEMLDTSLCHDTVLSPGGGSPGRERESFRRQLTNGNLGGSSLSGPGGLLSFTQGNSMKRVDDSIEGGGSDSDADSDELVHRHRERVHKRMQCLTRRNSEESHVAKTNYTDSLSHRSEKGSNGNSDSRSFTALGGDMAGNYLYNLNGTSQGMPLEMPVLGGGSESLTICRMLSSSAPKTSVGNTRESWMHHGGESKKNELTGGEDPSSSTPGLALFEEKNVSFGGDPNRLSAYHNNTSAPKNNENGFAPFTTLFLPVEYSPSREHEAWNGLGADDCSSDDWYARMRKRMEESSENGLLRGNSDKSDAERFDEDCPERDHTITNKDEDLFCAKSTSSSSTTSKTNSEGSGSKIHGKSSSRTMIIHRMDGPLESESCSSAGKAAVPLSLPALGKEDDSWSSSKELVERPPTSKKPAPAPRRSAHFSS